MFASFATSSHSRGWMYDSTEGVAAKRQATHEAAVTKLAQVADGDEAPPPPIARDDGELLCAFYESKLQDVCKQENKHDPARFTNRVLYTAQTYFKRFYLAMSPMEEDPKGVMLASLYVAGKVEEERIELADLVPKYAKQLQPQALLALELRLMEALRFQLVVRSPFRALTGLLQDLHAHISDSGAAGRSAAALAELEFLHKSAIDRVCIALKADVPFVHPPQQLALAALLGASDASVAAAGADAGSVDVRGWIEHRFGSGAGTPALLAQLAVVQQARAAHDVSAPGVNDRLKAIDASLKKLTRHAKKVEKAREEKLAAAEEAKREQRRLANAGDRAADSAKLVVKLDELKKEAHATASARLSAGELKGASDDFVLRKRRRTEDDEEKEPKVKSEID